MEMEQLLPLVARLTDKYTSKDSTSVTYETAIILMEAVIYTVNECQTSMDGIVTSGKMDMDAIYKKGSEIILDKVREANDIYERLIRNFQDYGCLNYKHTIIKGMPNFFMKYDAKFNPQNHLVMLDYPLLCSKEKLCGVDLILEYLQAIRLEAEFMSYFEPEEIRNILREITPEYRALYMDNICYPVLWKAVGCVIADKPVDMLRLEVEDAEAIHEYFKGDNLSQAENKIRGMIRMIVRNMKVKDGENYFEMIAPDYAARLLNGKEYVM